MTADAGALCLKAGNAVILRGGSDSYNTSHAIHACLQQGLKDANLPTDAIQMVPTADRAAVGALLTGLSGTVDVIVPRGGKSLVARVQNEARVPVFAHLEGICHVYVDGSADLEMAKNIVLNAKMRRTGICGAAETLLVDSAVIGTHLEPLVETLLAAGCEVRASATVLKIIPGLKPAVEEDWSTEYLDAIISVAIVDGVSGAIDHTHRITLRPLSQKTKKPLRVFLRKSIPPSFCTTRRPNLRMAANLAWAVKSELRQARCMHVVRSVSNNSRPLSTACVAPGKPGPDMDTSKTLARAYKIMPHVERGMVVGLFGGSFNPPHEGHQLVAETAIRRLGLDQLWWIVTPGNPLKNTSGLAPLAEHVVGLGMAFGLWVEPEMINPDSDLYRAHPDWCLHLEGRARPTARNQLVLDLAREEVVEHLFAQIGALLEALPITYLKWDHNRDLAPAGHVGRAAYRRQIEGAWRLMDRLRAKWPHVEIEACAGGGGRIDAGIIRRTHRFWTSDCIDAVSRMEIQHGFLQFMPPEIMGAHIGASPSHSTERSQALDFRAAVALPGHLGLEFDLRTMSAAEREELEAWIALYKRLRERLHTGKVWRGAAGDGVVWQTHGDEDSLILFAYRLAPPVDKYAPRLRLPMLRGAGPVRVRRIAQPQSHRRPRSSAPAFAAMAQEGVVMDGAWLALDGLPLPEMATEACEIFELIRERT